MTIAQQLHLSVLCTPVAAADRRALSQAWYSALYGSQTIAALKPPVHGKPRLQERSAQPTLVSTKSATSKPVRVQDPQPGATRVKTGLPPLERRGPRSALARKIEAAFLRPGVPPRCATFTIGEQRRVRISLRVEGNSARLIAVCAPSARKEVAQALAQARYALGLRGFALAADIHERSR